MNRIRTITLVLAIGWSFAASAQWVGDITGNESGGIIPWSEEHQAVAPEWAQAHCERYGKFARFTSMHPQYGDYIAFVCDWRDPRQIRRH